MASQTPVYRYMPCLTTHDTICVQQSLTGVCHKQILNTLEVPYETVNILEDELLRSGMKEYSQWPTFPQVYVDGEFYGGCDIMIGVFTCHISASNIKLANPGFTSLKLKLLLLQRDTQMVS